MRIAIFAGSSSGDSPRYRQRAEEFSRALATAGVGIVYGGGRVGLMGAVADGALGTGGEVIGVMPRSLVEREIAHEGLSRLEVVETLHQRKARMAELADAFVALPGGAGTLEEWFEAWTWNQLGLHHKPVALANFDGFWQSLIQLIDQLRDAAFLADRHRDAVLVVDDAAELMDAIDSWMPPHAKWTSDASTVGQGGTAPWGEPPADDQPRQG